MASRKGSGQRVVRWFKRTFLTGVLVLFPVALTIYIMYRLFRWVDGILAPLAARHPLLDIPGLGLLGVVVIVLAAGVLGGSFLGRTVFRWVSEAFEKIPMVRSLYHALRQTSEVFLKEDRTVFKRVVIVQYPRPGVYAIALETSVWRFRGVDGREQEYVTVFLPTTPNPTSGLLLLLPAGEVIPSDLTIEDALKMVISGGAVVPPREPIAADGRAGDTSGCKI